MVKKPAHIFDREREWAGLVAFVASQQRGAALGIVSGRRRQGKSYLLEGLTRAMGGLYFPAIEAAEAESLRLFGDALIRHTGQPLGGPLRDWSDAIPLLFRTVRDRVPVVIDEFPFLVKASPALPSIIQRELGPGGTGAGSDARLLLCGSAMSVMGGLLSGRAPLRGRAGLELVVQPFDHRNAARFWGISDPRLAAQVHAVVGGTPAYRREFVRDEAPADLGDFDDWVIRTVLDPQMPLFREARYLLAEEVDIRDPALYHSVLTAVALGNRTAGGIANYVGRRTDQLSHALTVLEDSGLLRREADMFRHGRPRYRVVEPLLAFYHAIMRDRWAELERGRARSVWRATRPTFSSQVMGPHFEALAREFAASDGPEVFGDDADVGEVGAAVVNDPQARTQIQVDVVVLAPATTDQPRRVVSLGEAKWGETMGLAHLERLARARDLLGARGHDVRTTKLACYSGAGFDPDLQAVSGPDRPILVDLPRMYGQES